MLTGLRAGSLVRALVPPGDLGVPGGGELAGGGARDAVDTELCSERASPIAGLVAIGDEDGERGTVSGGGVA